MTLEEKIKKELLEHSELVKELFGKFTYLEDPKTFQEFVEFLAGYVSSYALAGPITYYC